MRHGRHEGPGDAPDHCTGGGVPGPDTSHEGDSALASFSPRSQHLAIYLVGEFENRHQSALARLGPHQAGKGCLYIKRLGEVDQDALRELIDRSARVRKGIGQASG